MQKYEVKVFGNDERVYKVTDFVADGKTYMDAIGIVFGTPIIGLRVLAFGCSLAEWGLVEWSKTKTNSIITESHNEAQAVQILCGLEDTRRIVDAQNLNDETTAAKWCWQYRRGDCQWYLPSLMELGVLFLARDQINDAMKQLGCCSDCLLPTKNSDKTWVWSSSEYSQYGSWSMGFDNGYFLNGGKCFNLVVRAVAAPFSQSYSPNLFLGEAKSKDSKMSDEEIISILRSRGYTGGLKLTKTLVV